MRNKKSPSQKKQVRKPAKTSRGKRAPVIQVEDGRGLGGRILIGAQPARVKPSLADKVQSLIDTTKEVPIAKIIESAFIKALRKYDSEVMAELAKMRGIVQRVEEIVAVVERSEILLVKIDAAIAREGGNLN